MGKVCSQGWVVVDGREPGAGEGPRHAGNSDKARPTHPGWPSTSSPQGGAPLMPFTPGADTLNSNMLIKSYYIFQRPSFRPSRRAFWVDLLRQSC